jgi:hypothetical protein
MHEPGIRTSRLAIAGGLVAATVLGAAGFVIGRTTAPHPEPAPRASVAVPTPAPTPANDGILRRAELIALAASAADALTLGEEGRGPDGAAAGQRFELVLPYGCSGPDESGPTMRWHYDEGAQTLRVTVEPTSWTPEQWGLAEPARFEVAEGFWIDRPWSSSEACPPSAAAVASGTEAAALPGQTLAIAQFFTDETDRHARRNGRPYETVKRVPAGAFDGSRGFLLRITGRIEEVPGGGVVHCVQPAGAGQRPVCAIGARMDEVAIENPATGDVVASWRTETSG